MFLFLFPVSVRNSPPLTSFLFFNPVYKKRIVCDSAVSEGRKRMENDNVESVYEAARIVEQRPAQAQHQEHHQQWYDTLMDQAGFCR